MPEPHQNSARDAMLGRLRAIVGEAMPAETIAAEWQALPRNYRVAADLPQPAVIDLLINRLHDYDAVVHRIGADEIAATAAEILAELHLQEVLVPAALPPEWLPQNIASVEDNALTPSELDRFTAVLTASTLAIAETGTLILQNLPGQGRRAATLVPDVHLCVVFERDIVPTVPEAMRRLQATANLPTTFISGPSATADIEMTRIKGVHGPRFLHVLLVH